MLHNETRKLHIAAWNRTYNVKGAAECFSINTSTMYCLKKCGKSVLWKPEFSNGVV